MKYLILILMICSSALGVYQLSWDVAANPETLYQYLSNPAIPGDVEFDGGSYDVIWDKSVYTMLFEDSAILGFGNTTSSPDIYMRWDGTNFDILSSTAGYDINIGTNALGIDLIWNSDTSGDYVQFNEEDVTVDFIDVDLSLDDNADILLGSGDDVAIDFDGTYMKVVPAAAGTNFQIGTSTNAMDFYWLSDTSGDTIFFDEENVQAQFEDVQLQIMDDTTLSFGDGDDVTMQYDEDGDDDLQITGAVSFDNTVSFAGISNSVVLVTDAAEYDVTAANTGKVHVILDLTQNTSIDLPAEAAGLYYKFIYAGGADEAHDHTIDTENDTNFYKGGVGFFDTDAGDAADEVNAGIYSDGDSNSKFTINNASAGTVVEVFCDGTNWYISGRILSDTAPAFADQ